MSKIHKIKYGSKAKGQIFLKENFNRKLIVTLAANRNTVKVEPYLFRGI